jgi:hypothetical protein
LEPHKRTTLAVALISIQAARALDEIASRRRCKSEVA